MNRFDIAVQNVLYKFVLLCCFCRLPKNPLLMPTVGNGHMATVVYRDRLFLNGLYNGKGKKSHRAAIPSLNRIKLNLQQSMVEQSSFMLDCIRGIRHLQTPARNCRQIYINICTSDQHFLFSQGLLQIW